MLDQRSLLLDAGNTSIKYAYYKFGNDIADLQVMRTSIDSLPDLLNEVSDCFLCSVLDTEVNQQILEICQNMHVDFKQVNTPAHQFGIQNAYKTPQNMGTDRWMAIIAGAALLNQGTQNNYLVIDAGTAITCDFVVQNDHLGGWIAPGLKMARESVVRHTKRVFDHHQVTSVLMLGDDTPECVAQGALAQLTGMMLQAFNLMQKKSKKFEVFISGGDAPILIHAFTQSQNLNKYDQYNANINYVENLVLIGLAKISHENIATNG